MLGWYPYLARQRFPFNGRLIYRQAGNPLPDVLPTILVGPLAPHPSVDMG
ncbi:MAG: hypothetical protein J0H47_00425 [Gammaproteobacteria bacterium]|nr:hypothetical protein [Gammaproteobacteria bacterium]